MIALPTLIIFALMLETNMQGDWTEAPESRWTVLGIGIGLILISLLVCGYVTHRMGVCLWAGPQDDSDTQSNINRVRNLKEFSMKTQHFTSFLELLPGSLRCGCLQHWRSSTTKLRHCHADGLQCTTASISLRSSRLRNKDLIPD
uniref:Secreted protein n=1 Tax=Lutzomyia longipalpis TaxID=7200 RepID=A0A7G3B784_LUTLO